MQFIDQAPPYKIKSLSLDKAIRAGRARLAFGDGGGNAVLCFRPELKEATAFDHEINDRVDGLNKRMLEALISAGCFDSTGARRAQLLAVYARNCLQNTLVGAFVIVVHEVIAHVVSLRAAKSTAIHARV